jgi:hypothetical protein
MNATDRAISLAPAPPAVVSCASSRSWRPLGTTAHEAASPADPRLLPTTTRLVLPCPISSPRFDPRERPANPALRPRSPCQRPTRPPAPALLPITFHRPRCATQPLSARTPIGTTSVTSGSVQPGLSANRPTTIALVRTQRAAAWRKNPLRWASRTERCQ